MLNRRVQILFEKDSWNKLVKDAKSQRISAGEYIRRAIREYLENHKELVGERRGPFKRLFKQSQK